MALSYQKTLRATAVWLFDPQPDITPHEMIRCATLQPGFSAPSMLRLRVGETPPADVARHYRNDGAKPFPYPHSTDEAERWRHG